MATRLEESLERDIDRIRQQVLEMSGLAERALRDCVEALTDGNRQRAYAVILRDQYIDEKEKEIDRLCLEFLVRQQPVGVHLRLAYSTIKINLELERVGDYAESIARHLLRLSALPAPPENVVRRLVEMADLAIPMLHDSIEAFVGQDPGPGPQGDRGRAGRRRPAGKAQQRAGRGPARAAHRAGDAGAAGHHRPALRARVRPGPQRLHGDALHVHGRVRQAPGRGDLPVLFVDEHNACRSQMAEAIAQSLGQPKFIFSSAGLDPRALDPRTLSFMREKGFDLSRMAPKAIYQVPNLDHYQVIVGVAREAQQAFPRSPRKMVYVDWSIDDPSRAQGSPEEVRGGLREHLPLPVQPRPRPGGRGAGHRTSSDCAIAGGPS